LQRVRTASAPNIVAAQPAPKKIVSSVSVDNIRQTSSEHHFHPGDGVTSATLDEPFPQVHDHGPSADEIKLVPVPTAGDNVIPTTFVNLVCSRASKELIGASATGELIEPAGTGSDHVAARTSIDHIPSSASEDAIWATASMNAVPPGGTDHEIVARAAIHDGGALPVPDRVVAGPTNHPLKDPDISAPARADEIVSPQAVDAIDTREARDDVTPSGAQDSIGTRRTDDRGRPPQALWTPSRSG
jgi:hypothetical protein